MQREKARKMPVFDFFYHLEAVRIYRHEQAHFQAQLHGRELK